MICVFEKIYRTGPKGKPVFVEEEGPIHPKYLRGMTPAECMQAAGEGKPFLGRPTHLLTHAGWVPLDPEKFSIREPQTETEWYWARWNSLPEMVARVATYDAHLHSLLRRWALSGKIPAEWPPAWDSRCGVPDVRAEEVDAGLVDALAYAVVGMVLNKAAIMGAWAAREQERSR